MPKSKIKVTIDLDPNFHNGHVVMNAPKLVKGMTPEYRKLVERHSKEARAPRKAATEARWCRRNARVKVIKNDD